MRRFVLVVLALAATRSAHAQVSDADLAAHMDAKRAFDACMETRLAAMRDAMALPDEGARNAAIREIPICGEPPSIELPQVANGRLAPPSLLPANSAARSSRPVRRNYRELIVLANLGGAAAMLGGFAVDDRLGFAGAGVFTLASPALHYYFDAKDSVAPSLLIHGVGAGLAVGAVLAFPKDECPQDDLSCAVPASSTVEHAVLLTLGMAAGLAIITGVDARVLAKRDVYVTPYASAQGTAGVSLGGTF